VYKYILEILIKEFKSFFDINSLILMYME